jgi:hypothetical protein
MPSRMEARHARADQRFYEIKNELDVSKVCNIRWDFCSSRSALLEKKLIDAGYSISQYTVGCDHECDNSGDESYPTCYRECLITVKWIGSSREDSYKDYRCAHHCSNLYHTCSKGEWLKIECKKL